MKRHPLIDNIRFIGIILMIIYHCCWDMAFFKLISIDKNIFWWLFPRIIVTIFMITSGFSLSLLFSKSREKIKKSLKKQIIQLIISASLVSLTTFFLTPNKWIYFGILHSILVSKILAIPLARKFKLSFILSISITILFYFYPIYLPKMSHLSNDFIPIFPYFAIFLLGISLSPFLEKLTKVKSFKIIEFISRKSLIIYLIHQPIIFSIIWSVYKITNS